MKNPRGRSLGRLASALAGLLLFAACVSAAPLAIVTQPASQSVLAYSNATFAVAISGGQGAVMYQWSFNGTNLTNSAHISGATGSNLTVNGATAADAGNYQVNVMDGHSSLVSSNAGLTVLFPPAITNQPADQSIVQGGNAVFSVTVSGTEPFAYQWLKNSTNLPNGGNVSGANSSSLSLTNIQAADAGSYQVIVTNNYGAATSSVAALTVLVPVGIASQPAGGAVRAGGSFIFKIVLAGTPPFAAQWQFNGTNLADNIITTVAGNGAGGFPNYSGDGGPAISAGISAADCAVDAAGNIFIADIANNRIRKVDTNGIISTVAGNGASGFSGDGGPATNASLQLPTSVTVDAVGNIFIADKNNLRIRKVDTSGIITTVAGNGNTGYSGDGGPATNASVYYPRGVAVDAAGNIFISDTENNRIRKVDAGGIITTVAGTGIGGFSGDGNPGTGAKLNQPYGLNFDASGNLYIADSGNHRVRKLDAGGIISTVAGNGSNGFSGDGGAATNAALAGPADAGLDAGGNLFISDAYNVRIRKVDAAEIITTAAGNGLPDYSGDDGAATNAGFYPYGIAVDAGGDVFIADGNNNRIRKVTSTRGVCLSLNNLAAKDAGSYQVIVTNNYGAATSSVAALTVLFPPTIQTSPTEQWVAVGNTAYFSATASGTSPFHFQWLRNGTNLANGGRYTGASETAWTGQTFTIGNVDTSDSDVYQVVITNLYGQATSPPAMLNVGYPPVSLSIDPIYLNAWIGGTATFNAWIGGTPPFTFHWKKDGVEIPDDGRINPTNNPLVISPVQASDAGTYTINYIQNRYGALYASGFNGYLTVLLPPNITSQPQSQTAPAGTNVTFTVSATSANGSLSYQWRFNGTNLASATAAALTLTNVQSAKAGDYDVVVNNIGGSVTSSVAQLTVLASAPWFLVPPQSLGLPIGKTAGFNASARGSDPLSYQWRFNGQPISGATAPALTITNAMMADSGLYELIVTNEAGSLTGAVTLAVQNPVNIIRQPANLAVFAGSNLSFTATVIGTAPGLQWYFNGAPLTDTGRISGSTTPTLSIVNVQPGDAGGYYLRATNFWTTATSRTAALRLLDGLAQSVRFVNVSNPAPAAPYLDWATAATNIQDAIDAAAPGDTILVTNGMYSSGGRTVYGISTNRVTVDKTVTVKSVNGPADTIIQGSKIPTLAGTRCVYLTNGAALIGFTLTNGSTPLRTGDTFRDLSGGGVWCEDTSAVISNCIITSCLGYSYAGGAYQGTLHDCVLTNNRTGESKLGDGGGVYASVVYRSALIGNVGNSGGGACASTLIDCLLVRNFGYTKGGGASDSALIGCTVVSNQLYTQIFSATGGGVYGGSVLNSIICSNIALNAPNWTNSFVAHSCLTPAPETGFGNFTNPPAFADLPGGDLHLQPASPCINSGNNGFVASDTDKDGLPRIAGGTVDIGAYEYPSPASTLAYAWAQQYGLPTDGTADTADPDGDGLNNWQECRSGTNPTNAASVLRLVTSPATNNPAVKQVTWQSAGGITYFLQRNSSLLDAFSSIASNLVGQAGTTSYTDTTATNDTPYFYRVGVQ